MLYVLTLDRAVGGQLSDKQSHIYGERVFFSRRVSPVDERTRNGERSGTSST